MLDNTTKGILNGTLPYKWEGLELVSTMTDGGGADTGGPNPLPHGKAVWKPGTATAPALLSFSPIRRPQSKPWDNVYMYNTVSRNPVQLNAFCWELDFSIAQSDIAGNAREFEVELCESGWTYNMAWQYKWSHVDGPPAWRLFDQIAQRWIEVPSLPMPTPRAGVPIHVEAYFIVDRANGITTHDSIAINGTSYPVNLSHGKKQKWSSQTTYLHNAVQIDSMGDGVACTVQIRDWNIRGI